MWTGRADASRRALIVWETLCLQKCAGGINIIDLEKWNVAAIIKFLWALTCKADKLWVRWVHSYYIKDKGIQDCNWVLPECWLMFH